MFVMKRFDFDIQITTLFRKMFVMKMFDFDIQITNALETLKYNWFQYVL